MAKARPVRMSRAAQLGLIALVFIAAGALGVYFAARFVRGEGGYQIGVHFAQAAGVAPGAQVLLNGVNVGGVTKVLILPDNSVEFIINVYRDTDIPRDAKFSVQSALTGSPNVAITAPARRAAPLPKRILPVSEQPIGTTPLSLEIVMLQSRSVFDRASAALAQARPYGKRLAYHLQNARTNGGATMQDLRGTLPVLMGSLQSTMARAKANAQDAQTALRERNQQKIAAAAAAFGKTARDAQQTAGALGELKRDPRIRGNVSAASAQLRISMQNLAKLSHDMQMVTASRQTKAELRDAGARLRAILKKL